jgi:RNA polymerase sigma-70 factor (ECF subfamily)
MTSPPDSLVFDAARGDAQALTKLVGAYHDRLYRFGLRVCRDGFDAEDAVQEAFTTLARRPDVLRHPSALSWLMTVVRNGCRQLLRPFLRARPILSEQEDLVDPASDTHGALERYELVRQVHAALASLDQPSREVLVLRDLEGLSGEQTAAQLGLELATMKTRLHRARGKLREALRVHG